MQSGQQLWIILGRLSIETNRILENLLGESDRPRLVKKISKKINPLKSRDANWLHFAIWV